jgi:hypothetical protein
MSRARLLGGPTRRVCSLAEFTPQRFSSELRRKSVTSALGLHASNEELWSVGLRKTMGRITTTYLGESRWRARAFPNYWCIVSKLLVHRLTCTIFNGAPLRWDLTVGHLGPVDWNHPKLLRFCTTGYNERVVQFAHALVLSVSSATRAVRPCFVLVLG